jgi:hypothetical protein
VSDPVCPDHPEGTGVYAQAASGAFLRIKSSRLSFFMQGTREADRGAESLLAVMTKYGDGYQVLHVLHINVSSTTMLHLAGCLTGAAANASIDINIKRHLIPPGELLWRP